MINSTILDYITNERARGVTDADIRATLLTSGWKEDDVNEAFRGGAPGVVSAEVSPRVPPGLSGAYVSSLFKGRIGRWHYFFGGFLLTVLAFALIMGVSLLLASTLPMLFSGGGQIVSLLIMVFVVICIIVIPSFLLGLSLTVRRLHDLGHSGLWYLVSFIPFLGLMLTVYLLFGRGEQGGNRYGAPEIYERSFSGAWNSILRK